MTLMPPGTDTAIGELADFVARHPRLFVLTGAGISTDSGIPGYRDDKGQWQRSPPITLQAFLGSHGARQRYWARSMIGWPVTTQASPNAAHHALARMGRHGLLTALVTQNVDGLHQRAGTSADKIIEIHGTALVVGCLSCGARQDRDGVQARFAAGELDPHCACGGLLKPATISFGQAMPERETAMAMEDAAAADVLLVVGSSLVVYPAASLPRVAVENGARLIILNREPTDYDAYADVVLHTTAGPTLAAIAERIGLRTTDA